MDKIVSYLAGLGVPGVILLALVAVSPYAGAVAITASLALFGPGGMIGGVISLIAIGIISAALSNYGFDSIYSALKIRLSQKGITLSQVEYKIKKMWVTRSLKNKIRRKLGIATV